MSINKSSVLTMQSPSKMRICLFHACMIGNTLLNRKSCVPFTLAFSEIRKHYCFARVLTQTLLFRVSTLFTLKIGRHICMAREALASNFWVRLFSSLV